MDRIAERYAVAVSPAMAALIDPDDPNDPIARQFIPDMAELNTTPMERADPIGDLAHSPVEGIVHRYPDRVLLKAVHICPVYCRFCFRREMVGPQGLGTLSTEALQTALAYIRAHDEIWEVILTGGDPLVLSPRRLDEIMRALGRIDHVKVVRFHTRVPVVEPERVDDALLAALTDGQALGLGQDGLRGAPCQPPARAHRGGAGRLRTADRGGHRHGQPDCAPEGGQRRRRGSGDPDARLCRGAREALLPPPSRSRSGDEPLPPVADGGAGARRGLAGPDLRALPADLCPRHPGRLRQGQCRPRAPPSAPGAVIWFRTSAADGTPTRRSSTSEGRREFGGRGRPARQSRPDLNTLFRFTSDRLLLDSRRRFLEASVGRVGRRGLGRRVASWISSTRRSKASARFRSWRAMALGGDDQHAVEGQALARKALQPSLDLLGKGRRIPDVEAQLNRGGDLVDVLPARPGAANEGLGELSFV